MYGVVTGKHRSLRHPNQLTEARFVGNDHIVTGCFDWNMREWSLTDENQPPRIIPHMEVPNHCSVSSDNEYLAICSNNDLRVWKRPNQSFVTSHARWPARFWVARFSLDGKLATPSTWREHSIDFLPINSFNVIRLENGTPAGPEISVKGILDTAVCNDGKSVVGRVHVQRKRKRKDKRSPCNFRHRIGKELVPRTGLPFEPLSIAARPDKEENCSVRR